MSLCPPVRRTFSDERGTGTFHTLGVLPKRSREKSPVFHIPLDDDDDDDDHSSSLDEHVPLRFPTLRSPSPPALESSSPSASPPTPPRSQIKRGASTPILLSNGKPLKPSLKLPCSSPTIVIPPHQHMHSRARSEPRNPRNVHFPEKDYGLTTVCVFNRSARPAALSNPANGNGDETETEGEDALPTRFPFLASSSAFNYEIDPTKSSPIPSTSSPPANLFLESLNLSHPSASSSGSTPKPLLTGSILVRNLAFEKHVAIRFTLDDWQTVSEVGAHYVCSLSVLPSNLPSPSSTPGDTSPRRSRGWDRFAFTIHLEDYAHSLSTRTMWLVARYRINSTYPEPGSSQHGPGGEWWDNNGGGNYRVGFRAAIDATPSRTRSRRETISAPIPRGQLQPPMTCKEHVLGLMLPSFPSSEEDGRSTPLRTGKLSLCNYAPPTARATSSVAFPSPKVSLPSSVTNSTLPLSPDEDIPSPASSTLSTPSVSPTIAPRVIIGGQPATSMCDSSSREDNETIISKPGHIADWDWSAPGKPLFEGMSRQHVNPVPVSEHPECLGNNSPSAPGRQAVSNNNALYEAFVMQWCFAREPSPNHSCGIMT